MTNLFFARALAALALTFSAASGAATPPTINFDGALTYNHFTGRLEALGEITGTEGLSAAALAAIGSLGSTAVLLQASWGSTSVVTGGRRPVIIGSFDPTGDADLVITGADGTVVVQGVIASPAGLTLTGPAGSTFGSLMSDIRPTGGTLGGQFTDPRVPCSRWCST